MIFSTADGMNHSLVIQVPSLDLVVIGQSLSNQCDSWTPRLMPDIIIAAFSGQ